MEKVTISNLKGENGLVNVVRYFQNNGTQYLIYSLNEVDESGYTRLYIVKVNGTDGTYNAEMPNDTEWNDVKNLVRLIIKANKEGMPVPVQDLNPKKLENIMLKDKKIFKLNASLVNDLEKNKTNSYMDNNDESSDGQQKNPYEVSSTPVFESPVQPSFEMPSAPSFEAPSQPSFEMPSAPAFEAPSQPSFEMPSTPSFEAPSQPSFEMPSAPAFEAPSQPSFEMPSAPAFEAPSQPSFEMPSAPSFEAPSQPSFEIPSTPSFEAPSQPSFEIPSTPSFEAQSQPSFEIPSAPAFEAPSQPSFEIPSAPAFEMPNTSNSSEPNFTSFETPVQPTFELNNMANPHSNDIQTNNNDYKIEYENLKQKNVEMQNEIDALNQEIERYKSIMSNLKEIIEK